MKYYAAINKCFKKKRGPRRKHDPQIRTVHQMFVEWYVAK